MRIEELAERLDAKKTRDGRWMARCPAHADKSPSLSLGAGRDGQNLLHCFAQCSVRDIARAMGVTLPDLLTDQPSSTQRPPRRRRGVAEIALAMALEQRWVTALNDYRTADDIRHAYARVRQTWRWANDQCAGDGSRLNDRGWDVLAVAARLNADVEALEAGL